MARPSAVKKHIVVLTSVLVTTSLATIFLLALLVNRTATLDGARTGLFIDPCNRVIWTGGHDGNDWSTRERAGLQEQTTGVCCAASQCATATGCVDAGVATGRFACADTGNGLALYRCSSAHRDTPLTAATGALCCVDSGPDAALRFGFANGQCSGGTA